MTPPPVEETTNLGVMRRKHEVLAKSGVDVSYVPEASTDHLFTMAHQAALPMPKTTPHRKQAVAKYVTTLPTVMYFSEAAKCWTLGRVHGEMDPEEIAEEAERINDTEPDLGKWYWLEYEDGIGAGMQAVSLEALELAACERSPRIFFFESGTAFDGVGLNGEWWCAEQGGDLNWAQCSCCRAWREVKDDALYSFLREHSVDFSCSDIDKEKKCGARFSDKEKRYCPELKTLKHRKQVPVKRPCDRENENGRPGAKRPRSK